MRSQDPSAVALQDATGAGDPSGRGDAFSFVREFVQRRLRAAPGPVPATLPGADAGEDAAAFHVKKEGTDRDARALTLVQLAEILQEFGVPVERIRRLRRWERVHAIRAIQNEQMSLRARGAGGGGGAAAAVLASSSSVVLTGEQKLSARDRLRIKSMQALEIQRRQAAVLAAREPPALAPDDEEEEGEEDSGLSAELELEMENAIRKDRARGSKGLAEEDERAEFEAFRRQLKAQQQGQAGGGPFGAVAAGAGAGAAGSAATPAAAAGGGGGRIRLFPLPLELQRPPHAEIVPSRWSRAGGPAGAPPGAGGPAGGAGWAGGMSVRPGAGSGVIGSMQAAAAAAAGGSTPAAKRASALATDSRPGARNPLFLGDLAAPPRLPDFHQDEASEAWVAGGKILRITRTVVDAAGKQTVRVTYTTNRFVLLQAWLRQRHGVNLSLLGLRYSASSQWKDSNKPPAIDPTLKGLVGTGVFPHPRSAPHLKREADRQREEVRRLYRVMWDWGLVLDGRADPTIPAKARRVIVHGTAIPICSACRLWGHKASTYLCPKATAEGGGPVTAAGAAAAAAAATGASAGGAPGPARRGRPPRHAMAAAAAAEGGFGDEGSGTALALLAASQQRMEIGGATAGGGPAGAGGGMGASRLSASRLREIPALRQLLTVFEKALLQALNNSAFDLFWHPVDANLVPGYDRLIARPMDLSTMRRKVVRREYASKEAFMADVELIVGNCETFNAGNKPVVAKAHKLRKFLTSLVASSEQGGASVADIARWEKAVPTQFLQAVSLFNLRHGMSQEEATAEAAESLRGDAADTSAGGGAGGAGAGAAASSSVFGAAATAAARGGDSAMAVDMGAGGGGSQGAELDLSDGAAGAAGGASALDTSFPLVEGDADLELEALGGASQGPFAASALSAGSRAFDGASTMYGPGSMLHSGASGRGALAASASSRGADLELEDALGLGDSAARAGAGAGAAAPQAAGSGSGMQLDGGDEEEEEEEIELGSGVVG